MYERGPKPRADHFKQEGGHLRELLVDRDRVNEAVVPLGVSFLDDCLGGAYPRDLLLIGAGSGVGKTGLSVSIAKAGLASGKKVYGFFLEAFEGEVSYRLYYEELGAMVKSPTMDYSSWVRGEWKHLDEKYGPEVERRLEGQFKNFYTCYKTTAFTHKELQQRLELIQDDADMVILDHLHVVDSFKAEDENSTQSKVIGLLRDLALTKDIPVIVVSHTKKKQSHNYKNILPTLDDLHGSSNLYKVATQVIVVGRDWEAEPSAPHKSVTLIGIEKDRKGRKTPYIARTEYDLSRGVYDRNYLLGRIKSDNKKAAWEEVERKFYPYWARK